MSTAETIDASIGSPLSRLRVWGTVLRICIEERLVYRGDFALGTLMRFMPIVTQIFLWKAIFTTRDGANIAGYSEHDMIAYYLLTMVSRAFSSMPGLASGIALQIRNGEIKKFLIQPVDFIGFFFLSRLAHKLVYYFVATAPFALVFFLCRDYFPGWPEPHVMAAFIASLVMSFLLGYFLEATLGMIGFWLLEVSSLLFVYMLFTFFLSGHMFPIDLLNGIPIAASVSSITWGDLVRWLPLQYLAYFPAAVFLGKVQGADLALGLAVQFGWVVTFIVASRVAFHYGVRRYSGFGG